jgi:hypothetical protein
MVIKTIAVIIVTLLLPVLWGKNIISFIFVRFSVFNQVCSRHPCQVLAVTSVLYLDVSLLLGESPSLPQTNTQEGKF